MSFAGGKKRGKLEQVGKVGKANTGTTIRFWPDPQYFDSAKFSISRLKHACVRKPCCVRASSCGSRSRSRKEKQKWCYSGGLEEYLLEAIRRYGTAAAGAVLRRASPATTRLSTGHWPGQSRAGRPSPRATSTSFPTPQGGTHVNGLRTGLTNAIREFCDFRNFMPRGVSLAPEDVWDGVNFVLSAKLEDPQFSGQTKERLSSRESAAFMCGRYQGQLRDLAEPASRDRRPDCAARHRQGAATPESGQESRSQESRLRSGAAGQARRLHVAGAGALRTVPRRGRFRRAAPPNRHVIAIRRRSCRCGARS